jgi:predicted transposase/invertase (TIGR01784 family)
MAITYDIEKDTLYQKGLKKGEEKGEQKGILITALKMKKAGFAIQDIMKVTDLTKEQIEKL